MNITLKMFRLFSFCMVVFATSCTETNRDESSDRATELDGLKVPDGFTIERIVDPKLVSYPMFGSFDSAGRLFVFESDGSTPTTEEMLEHPSYRIRLLTDTTGDGVFDKSTIFADSLTFPKGGVFYKGSLYTTSSPDLLRLTDTDDDGVADQREKIHTGWKLNVNGAILGGPFMGPDGYLYLTDARRGFDITNKEGVHFSGKGARIWRCLPDGSKLEPILGGGFDNAIELVFMPSGDLIGTMTYFLDPQGGLRDALMHWVEGGVYPKPHNVIDEDKLKLTGDLMPVMTKLSRVAPSGLMIYRGDAFGKEFQGNLFSAEFNTGRIIRSRISPDGATFKTDDEPFITATRSDVHPTDVFEDADGSMIVMNTGGWFIAGCPLSRVAKLDVPGGIYRVRKTGAPKIEDPRGFQINFAKATPGQLCNLTQDQRHVVRERAIEQLVDLGSDAVPFVMDKLMKAPNEQTRSTGVFILGRTGTEKALHEMMSAFEDSSATVRIAAARMAGLHKHKPAGKILQKLVEQSNLAVKRQAAIALGQIGDTGAVTSLLTAASSENDRFSEHALIHAMTSLNHPQPLIAALQQSSVNMSKAALIALDQMDGDKLDKSFVAKFLESDNELLQHTASWVTMHHPDWADVVVNYAKKRSAQPLNVEQQEQLQTLLTKFSTDVNVQTFISEQLGNPNTDPAKKTLLLNVIAASAIKNVPSIWTKELGKLLNDSDAHIRSRVLAVIQTRSLKSLNQKLNVIVLDETASADLRLKAFAAKLSSQPAVDQEEFRVLMHFLDKKNDIAVRQQASRLLSTAELSAPQLLELSSRLADTEAYLVPNLAVAFEGSKEERVGKAFVTSLRKSSSTLDNVSRDDLKRIIEQYPPEVQKMAAPLFETINQKNAARLSQLQKTDSMLKNGDIHRGRTIFFGKSTCASCHAINDEGSKFAPDLTNIGEIRSRHDILEAIMFPSASFAREHETNRIVTKSQTYTGIIKEQFSDALIVATGPGAETRIARSEITGIEPATVSMMPPGLEKQLTQQELADLLAYLVSLPDGASGKIGY